MGDVLRQKLNAAGGSLAISGVSARTPALARGTYRCRVTVDAYVKQGGSTVVAATPVPPAGDEAHAAMVPFWVTVDGDTDAYVAVITDGAAGKLFYKWMAP